MASLMFRIDQGLGHGYMKESKKYIVPNHFGNYVPLRIQEPALQQKVAQEYREYGYPLVARRFEALAQGEQSPDLWDIGAAA